MNSVTTGTQPERRVALPVLLFEWPRTFTFVRPSPVADRFLICNEPNPGDNIDMIHYVSGWK